MRVPQNNYFSCRTKLEELRYLDSRGLVKCRWASSLCIQYFSSLVFEWSLSERNYVKTGHGDQSKIVRDRSIFMTSTGRYIGTGSEGNLAGAELWSKNKIWSDTAQPQISILPSPLCEGRVT